MESRVPERGARGLERSCGTQAQDWFWIAPGGRSLERLEARLERFAFTPHRHDTYAMGVTVQGVQAFRYRGAAQRSLPGQAYVLHPDETHDGHAGEPAGCRYRTVYAEPAAIRDALGDARALPFVPAAVPGHAALTAAIRRTLEDFDQPLEDLQCDQLLVDLADALAAADPSSARGRPVRCNVTAVQRARECLHHQARQGATSAELERVTGLTRYELARQFRIALGTSPHRYLLLRRLDRVRELIRQGEPLAEAALASGFADQSHMTRHFKKVYGLSPGRWASLLV